MAATKKVSKPRGAPAPKEMSGLPERLKRAMRERGNLTQLALEEISGVAQSAISALGNGITLDNATCATVARLALDVDLDWLVLGEGDDVPRMVRAAKDGAVAVLDENQSPPLVPPPAEKKTPKPRKRFPRRP